MKYRGSVGYVRSITANLFKTLVLFSAAGLAFGLAEAQQTVPAVTGNKRVDQLLSELSLQEKIALLHGTDERISTSQGEAGYAPGVPRLGIPPMRLADGPPGVLTRVPSTAPTGTMGLAATFSVKDAELNGEVIGREARSHGIDVILEPFINIDRDFDYGRGYNTFGEDPLLTGLVGAAEIKGIQREGIMAQAKHYVAYDTNGSDVYVDDQALHEVYLAPFEAASDAGVSSIMCSYNKVNGLSACGNRDTLNSILRDQIGFKGFVTSDWGATHATDFINAGLDMEMPGPLHYPTTGPSFFAKDYPHPHEQAVDSKQPVPLYSLPEEPLSFTDPYPPPDVAATDLESEVRAGTVSEATITRAVGRILVEMDAFGLLGGKKTPRVSSGGSSASIIEKTGEDAAVLLKNDAHVLPLTLKKLESIAFIGPGAAQLVAVGMTGEKAVGLPQRQVGPLTALKRIVGNAPGIHISFAVDNDMEGTPVPAKFLSHGDEGGLGRTVGNTSDKGIDNTINFTVSHGNALLPDHSYAWQGILTAPETGKYRIHLQVLGCFASLNIDGKKVAENGRMWIHGDVTQAGQDNVFPTLDRLDNIRIESDLDAGPHSLTIAASPDGSHNPVQIRLAWVLPGERTANRLQAIEAARTAQTAVVFAWSRGTPTFKLPGDQEQLIEQVAAVNPNTIVVLNISQPIAMPWLSKVKAVLVMWWPGDEGGWATARVLLGQVSPAGRLPFTWPRRLEDTAAGDPAHPERSGTGANGKTTFSEGVLVGYRWFDAQNIDPLFPFGYGLSYSRFSYAGLSATRTEDGGIDATFKLENIGNSASDEVPQLYLGAPETKPEGVQFAVRKLAAFDRIYLEPGHSKTVSIHIPLRQLQYWSNKEQAWRNPVGPRKVYVGGSSRDLRLSAEVAP